MSTPEFSRPIRIDTLGGGARGLSITAETAELSALAQRFDLVEIAALSAEAELVRAGDTVRAKGRLAAQVAQSCVATGVPVSQKVDEAFEIEFRPIPSGGRPDEEVELSEGELDVIFYKGGAIDLGEAVAETLSLAIDPFPRSPEAEAALREAGVKTEEESKPAGAFAGLKDILGGKA